MQIVEAGGCKEFIRVSYWSPSVDATNKYVGHVSCLEAKPHETWERPHHVSVQMHDGAQIKLEW